MIGLRFKHNISGTIVTIIKETEKSVTIAYQYPDYWGQFMISRKTVVSKADLSNRFTKA